MTERPFPNQATAIKTSTEIAMTFCNPLQTAQPTLGDLIYQRVTRREVMNGLLSVTVLATWTMLNPLTGQAQYRLKNNDSDNSTLSPMTFPFTFQEIEHGVDGTHHVAPGYDAQILIRWGDPVVPGAPNFDPYQQTPQTQRLQFGYNNDFIGYIPLPFGSNNSDHGLLCVNHEYTNASLMFAGLDKTARWQDSMTATLTEIEMAAHGASIIEIKQMDGHWQVIADSHYARRITALDTEMRLSGPAAGHKRLSTSTDPTGTRVVGTINNCAGGITPWGTYLMAEENFHGYFWGNLATHPKERLLKSNELQQPITGEVEEHPESRNYTRYGIPGRDYVWGQYHARWNIHAEPNEANRFGWIVEVDPLDPHSVPVKRTALGRFKHEGAETVVNHDGRVVLYSGDDEVFEYVYKFITHGRFDRNNRSANRDLLDNGTLYVARFHADGTLTWLPLVFGTGGLTPENGFYSQADVLIETRRAADILGATPMDRPEDIEADPKTNKVYVLLTNNSKRTSAQVDAANPRAGNSWGHILELIPPEGDHGALTYRWEVLVKCGNPKDSHIQASWNPATSENGWFACPDNCAVNAQGQLWIATDQGNEWANASGTADGLWALATDGQGRGTGKMFFRAPVGAELCGPRFTPDDQTLFLAIQHPASDGTKQYKGFERTSTFADPATRWPDFDDKIPPRPSVVVVTKKGGGIIGT